MNCEAVDAPLVAVLCPDCHPATPISAGVAGDVVDCRCLGCHTKFLLQLTGAGVKILSRKPLMTVSPVAKAKCPADLFETPHDKLQP